MKRLILLLSILAASATFAPAQSLKDYLALRQKNGITQAVGVEALETLIGTRVVEVKGIVKGTFKMSDKGAIMLERADGETLVVEAQTIPDWLETNEVPARLLIKASRSEENAPLKTVLIGAAPESPIHSIELAADRKLAKEAVAARRKPAKIDRHEPARRTKDWSLPASQVTPYYRAFIKKENPKLSDYEADRIATGIVGFSIKYGVDARLIMAMVMVESGFDPHNTNSRSGAMGLGQLMPGTAKWMGVTDAYDSIDNLYGCVKLIRTHLDTYKKQTGQDYQSLVLALAAYNAGDGAVRRAGGVPPYRETQAYIKRVIGIYRQLRGM